MTRAKAGRRRTRGTVDVLPSGALRVRVYAGKDPVSGRRHDLVEIVPAGPKAAAQAEAVRTRLLNQVDERRHPRTSATVDQLLDRHFEMATLAPTTLATYVGYATKHIRPLIGQLQVGALDADLFDSFYAELRRCRDHCDRRPRQDHRTAVEHECDARCRPHRCTPLSASAIRQIHFILSGALKRAVRWRWIGTSPIHQAEPPAAPKPDPRPPTADEAARLLNAAWEDPDWATLVWLAMVTGARRGELCALRRPDVDLAGAVLNVRRSIWQRSKTAGEKDTKDHQKRRIALDAETVGILAEHLARADDRAAELGVAVADDAFLFSACPDSSTHLLPDSVSQRFGALADRLGIVTTLHKLRHYSATELIAAGVDPRTVAGRLGHGGGGTTTLRFYSAWVSESDQRAASTLRARMPSRSTAVPLPPAPRHPYLKLAALLRDRIAAGTVAVGEFLPGQKVLAAEHGVSVGTAYRAVSQLAHDGLVEVVPGHGFRVVSVPAAGPIPDEPAKAVVRAASTVPPDHPMVLLDLVLRHRGQVVSRFSAEADPDDSADLTDLVLSAIQRSGGEIARAAEYELEMRRSAADGLLRTFVVSHRRAPPR